MTKKSLNRQIKNLEDRKAKKAMAHLDALAAAYMKEIGIPPSEAAMIAEELPHEDPKRRKMKYSFVHVGPTINQELAHPDVKILVQYSLLIRKAHLENNAEDLKAVLDQMSEFLKKYEDEENAAIEREKKLQDSVGDESGRS